MKRYTYCPAVEPKQKPMYAIATMTTESQRVFVEEKYGCTTLDEAMARIERTCKRIAPNNKWEIEIRDLI